MALNQKYTWNDFLTEHPEMKKKKVKRTSAEGQKAYEAAYKLKMKDYLKTRTTFVETETKRVEDNMKKLAEGKKAAKKITVTQRFDGKIGKLAKYADSLKVLAEHTKGAQKAL